MKTNLPLAVKKFKSALKNARKFGFKFEALHAKTGLFYCGKGKETGREYSKIKSKWPDVLKRNTPVVLNFP